VIRALGLSFKTIGRWRQRQKEGRCLWQKPGPKKGLPLPRAELERELETLDHGNQRSRGVRRIYQKYREAISRRELAKIVKEERTRKNQQRRGWKQKVEWKRVGVCWAMDSTEKGRNENGKKIMMNTVRELKSRYELEPIVSESLTGKVVAQYLEKLFRKYGAPLFLKRDNGLNLNSREVNAVMDRYGVLPLNSPAFWPRYNGARERGIQELKNQMKGFENPMEIQNHQALAEAAANRLNVRKRACLNGKNAMRVYTMEKHQKFGKKQRREIFEWIKTRSMTILLQVKQGKSVGWNDAWRQAAETWLKNHHLIKITNGKQCYPVFTPSLGHHLVVRTIKWSGKTEWLGFIYSDLYIYSDRKPKYLIGQPFFKGKNLEDVTEVDLSKVKFSRFPW